jgi:hypothetical protein
MKHVLGGLALVVALVLYPILAHSNSGGAPAGRTGAPGETTCNSAGCHNSFDLDSGPGALSIDAPTTYTPGEPLDLTVRLEQDGISRFGFQISVRDADRNQVGRFELVDASETRFASQDDNYVTHRFAGTSQTNVATWDVRWIPPDEGVGPVTFYAAGNAANNNGTNQGDQIYTTTEDVDQGDANTALDDATTPAHFTLRSLYPNPARTEARIDYELPRSGPVTVALHDALGRQVRSLPLGTQAAGAHQAVLDVADLAPGLYLCEVATPTARQTRTLVVTR